ncbi:ubiquitin-protein ligase E3A [Stemphylium lycopersici]|nr:hect-domain-containing protein [Stemphylium lycopersici]RAR09854.1 ubiquitin-protein ligase E3A [Stemphylium lycopersici]
MTDDTNGSDGAQSSRSSTRTDGGQPRRPSRGLSNSRTDGLVAVQDAQRVLECSQAERQRGFQHVVRQNAYCDTPTCLSSHTRNPSKPHRPPTQLTATTLAHYLASQDNPNQGLCPHQLNVAPTSFEIEAVLTPSASHAEAPQHGKAMGELKQRQQARKDPKALGQNLYDSLTMIYSYTKQIPTPASIIASLSASHDTSNSAHPSATSAANGTWRAEQSNGHAAHHHHPRPKPGAHENGNAQLPSNGLQIHKIPYHPPSGAQPRFSIAAGAVATDDATDSTMMSISKSGRKSFTLGGPTPAVSNGIKPALTPENATKEFNCENRPESGVPVIRSLSCKTLDELKDEVQPHGPRLSADPNYVVDYNAHRWSRHSKPIVNRSLFYTLSDPETLLSSFHDISEAFKDSPLPHLDSHRLANSFRDWNRRSGALIFDSLWLALEALFTPPPELDVHKSSRPKPARKGVPTDSLPGKSRATHDRATNSPRYLSTREAAHIVMICIHALTSSVPIGSPHTWAQIRKLRASGIIVPNAVQRIDASIHPLMDIIDELEYEPAFRLANRLLRAIGTRCCFEHILQSSDEDRLYESGEAPSKINETLLGIILQHLEVVENIALMSKHKLNPDQDLGDDPGWTVTATYMEWVRTIIIKEWDSKAEINKWTSVGTAVMTLGKLHLKYKSLNLRPSMFEMPIFNERLSTVTEPAAFIAWRYKPNTLHILDYPCLFSAQHLVTYFRTINFTQMIKQYDHTIRTRQMQASLNMFLREPYRWVIKSRMKVTISQYLVLDVSREDPLKDTLDQLWGQDRKMLLKPLKVKMGHNEGEIGVDHGGVTYEFFRIVLREAFKPEHGMFTIDPESRMTWFQPGSLEPFWKFEMLGVLFSLAVYNGITLPVTFPLAFYDFLRSGGNPGCIHDADCDPLEYIRDGWPRLAQGFTELLSWDEGDVEDVFMRGYVFSYEVFGQRIDHDLEQEFYYPEDGPPPSPEREPAMVTNLNREQYVKDYVVALTYGSVAPQLEYFLKGFLNCIDAKSLYLFTPLTLRNLIEGSQHISVLDLKCCAKYENGYSPIHSTIRAFWQIVERYSQEDCRHLLEFVTASDRVPVTGYESITFHIAKIGGAPDALPTSSTCFGKLYLPEYKDKAVLERKLGLAIPRSPTGSKKCIVKDLTLSLFGRVTSLSDSRITHNQLSRKLIAYQTKMPPKRRQQLHSETTPKASCSPRDKMSRNETQSLAVATPNILNKRKHPAPTNPTPTPSSKKLKTSHNAPSELSTTKTPAPRSSLIPRGPRQTATLHTPTPSLLLMPCTSSTNPRKATTLFFRAIPHSVIDWSNAAHIRKINAWRNQIYGRAGIKARTVSAWHEDEELWFELWFQLSIAEARRSGGGVLMPGVKVVREAFNGFFVGRRLSAGTKGTDGVVFGVGEPRGARGANAFASKFARDWRWFLGKLPDEGGGEGMDLYEGGREEEEGDEGVEEEVNMKEKEYDAIAALMSLAHSPPADTSTIQAARTPDLRHSTRASFSRASQASYTPATPHYQPFPFQNPVSNAIGSHHYHYIDSIAREEQHKYHGPGLDYEAYEDMEDICALHHRRPDRSV